MPTFAPDQQFKLYGPDGRIIASGSMSAVTERILDSKARSDSLSLLNDAAYALGLIEKQELAARRLDSEREQLTEQKVRMLCDSAARLAIRFDNYEQRRIARNRRDAEEEQQQIQARLAALPDPDEPDPFSPSGELHDLPPAEPGTTTIDNQGDLPAELNKAAPPPLGTDPIYDPKDLAHPPDPPAQPVAISLNAQE